MPTPPNDAAPSAASQPLRLDGAFARKDAEDWESVAEASLKGKHTLAQLVRHTADGLPIPLLGSESPVEGRHVAGASTYIHDTPASAGDGHAHDTPRWDNRLVVRGANPAAASAHALIGLRGGMSSLEVELRSLPGLSVTMATGSAMQVMKSYLERVLQDVQLEMITLSLRAGVHTEAAMNALDEIRTDRNQGTTPIAVELDADPVAELARTGRLTRSPEESLAALSGVFARSNHSHPTSRSITVDTVVHHAAGATPNQELVAALATGTLYLDALLDAGADPIEASSSMTFRFALDADVLAGIVKLRAFERLWRHSLARAGLPVVRPQLVAETSQRQLSSLAPWVNHLRNVAACTAAGIGGARTMIVHPHDLVDGQRLGDQSAIADRVARNVPILLDQEAGLLKVEDATGGAHAIETMTQQSAEAVWGSLRELQALGGMVAALQGGSWQAQVAQAHGERISRLARGQDVRVGVNRYRHDGTSPPQRDEPASSHSTTSLSGAAELAMLPVREAAFFETAADKVSATAGAGDEA